MSKEELTTAMHEEFIGHEISHLDLMVMGAFGAMKGGLSKQEALQKYELTEDEYDNNVQRVIWG